MVRALAEATSRSVLQGREDEAVNWTCCHLPKVIISSYEHYRRVLGHIKEICTARILSKTCSKSLQNRRLLWESPWLASNSAPAVSCRQPHQARHRLDIAIRRAYISEWLDCGRLADRISGGTLRNGRPELLMWLGIGPF